MTPDELEKLRIAAAQSSHKDEGEFAKAVNRAAVDSGIEAIKAILLINGGSAVAMLAFVGTLATKAQAPVHFAPALTIFAVGVFFAVSAAGAGYFTNLSIANTSNYLKREYQEPFLRDTPKSKQHAGIGEVCRWLSVLFAGLGIGCFLLGVVFAYAAFGKLAAL